MKKCPKMQIPTSYAVKKQFIKSASNTISIFYHNLDFIAHFTNYQMTKFRQNLFSKL